MFENTFLNSSKEPTTKAKCVVCGTQLEASMKSSAPADPCFGVAYGRHQEGWHCPKCKLVYYGKPTTDTEEPEEE